MDNVTLVTQIFGLLQFLNSGLCLLFGLIILITKRPWPWVILCLGMSAQALANVVYHIFNLSLDYFYFIAFLYGPCTLLAIQLTLSERQITSSSLCIHFLPIIGLVILKMIGLIAWRTVLIIMVIQNFSYLLYSWLRLKTYQKSYETLRASGIPGNFIWLQIWVMSLIMIGFGQAMRSLIGLTQPSSILLGIFLNVAITLYFGTFLLYGFINKTIGRRLTDEEEQESRAIYNPAENDGDNLGEGTDTQTITRVQNRLEYLLSVEKIYLSEDLSIHDLAKKIGYPARKLSAHISKHYGYTFPELINRLRVDQAKRLICDPAFAHIGLTDLGLRSGFNSRASFNLMFKRIAGITPREYRKSAGTVEEPPHSETLSPAPYRET